MESWSMFSRLTLVIVSSCSNWTLLSRLCFQCVVVSWIYVRLELSHLVAPEYSNPEASAVFSLVMVTDFTLYCILAQQSSAKTFWIDISAPSPPPCCFSVLSCRFFFHVNLSGTTVQFFLKSQTYWSWQFVLHAARFVYLVVFCIKTNTEVLPILLSLHVTWSSLLSWPIRFSVSQMKLFPQFSILPLSISFAQHTAACSY